MRRERVLGKGSYGIALLMRDLDTNSYLVAKEVNIQPIKPKELEGLHREIRILKSISHPNIVRYLDSMTDGPFLLVILMEYCDAGDLAQRIAQRTGGMAEGEIVSILIQVLMALRYLHVDHRILHRDLKPQNIFLDSAGIVKLGDFGVSTVLSQTADFAKTFCGSPFYLAPEMCEEKPYNGMADLWALGCVIYECMRKGERPFNSRNLVALVRQIIHCEYDPIKESEGFSSDLIGIVTSLLQHLPTNRPTIRRLLRLPIIQRGVKAGLVPKALMATSQYKAQFEERRGSLGTAQRPSPDARALADVVKRSIEVAEVDAWASRDKESLVTREKEMLVKGTTESKTAVPSTTMQQAPAQQHKHPSPLASTNTHTQSTLQSHQAAQLREAQRSPGASSSGTILKGTATNILEDDDTWNSRYEDETFEDEDGVNGGGDDDDAQIYANWKVSDSGSS